MPGARRALPGISGLDFQDRLDEARHRSASGADERAWRHPHVGPRDRRRARSISWLKPFRDQDMLDAVATAIERDRENGGRRRATMPG